MDALVWIVALLVVGLAVLVLEVFLPSGGVLGFLSVLAIGAAIVMAFTQQGAAAGLAVLVISFVAVPAVLALAFRWFPDTPLGRRVLPPPPGADDVLPAAEHRRRLRDLVGRWGRVTSELMPWGEVTIDGLVHEAISESGPIAAGAEVEAVAVEGRGLVVRPRAGTRPPAAPPPAPSVASEPHRAGPATGPAASEQPAQAGPLLSKTLEEFDFDQLEPPAA
jgi:membrane-bound ClpP family serine protease